MSDDFKSKVAFIVETDGLLKYYMDSVVIKDIKSKMSDDTFKCLNTNHVHAALVLKNIAPCSLKKFAETMRMSTAAASALVDRMVTARVIRRQANPRNRREVLLTVSSEFEVHLAHVRSKLTRWFETLTTRMGMDTFEKWYDVMVSLNQVIQKEIESNHAVS
jgi:DNA-binding MarR family transcriptional regulator